MSDKNLLEKVGLFVFWCPWAWLLVFGLFVSLITLQKGSLPTYGQPDPKFAGIVSVLYLPTILLLVSVVVTTPVGAVWSLIKLWRASAKGKAILQICIYVVGLGLFWAITKYDMLGLMNWLAD